MVIPAYQDDGNCGIEPFGFAIKTTDAEDEPGELPCMFRFRQMTVLSGERIGSLPRSWWKKETVRDLMRRKVLVWVRDAHATHDQPTMRDVETRHNEVVNARSGCTDEMRVSFRYDA
jgi:hypothetical protein